MGSTTLKEIAIEKIIKLPKDEVAKILIFMAGLDAGMQAINSQSAEKGGNRMHSST